MNLQESKQTNVDPVCGMRVDPQKAAGSADFDGRTYFFCAESCRDEFQKHPQKYLEVHQATTKRKGFWKRYLDRLNKATGGKPPECCH
jgi:YHS domain-containing protein